MKLFLIVKSFSIVTFLCFQIDAKGFLYRGSKSSSLFVNTNTIYSYFPPFSPNSQLLIPNSYQLANNWYKYTAKDSSYTVYFPGQPKEENLSVNTSLGILNALFVFYRYPEKQRFFSVSSMKYPVDPSQYNVEKGLDGARDGAAINSNSNIINEKKISYKGFPGREIILQSKDQPDFKLLLRIYIDPSGPKLYSLQVIAEDGNLDFPEAKAFLDSFSIANNGNSYQKGEDVFNFLAHSPTFFLLPRILL